MRKNLAFGVMFALTVVFGTAFTARAATQTAVNGLIFGDTKANIFDILAPQAPVTIVNYDFNAATSTCAASPAGTAPGVTSVYSTSETTCTTTAGTATNAQAFTQNTVAGSATGFNNSSATTSKFFQFALSGLSANSTDYKVYFQSLRSGTGFTTLTLQYSLDGTTFTDAGTQTVGTSFTTAGSTSTPLVFTLPSAVNGAANLTLRLVATGATGTGGTIRIDNFQVQSDNGGTASPTVSLSASANTATEAAATTITITATLSAAAATDTTVTLGTSGTATVNSDYTLGANTLTIPAGQMTASTTFTVIDDAAVEASETATITITGTTGGATTGTPASVSISIADNDAAAQPDLTITQSAPATAAVNGTLTYTLVVANGGAAVGAAFDATFELPAGVSNATVVNDGCFTGSSIVGTTVTFTGCATLATNAATTLTVTVTPTQAGTITSGAATVDSGNTIAEANEANNTAAGVATTVSAPISVVINEIYGGGGNTGAAFNADYIELFNTGTTDANLSGYSLQYASSAGTSFTGVIVLPNVSIPAGGVFLVQTQPAGTTGAALTADFTSPNAVNLSGTDGNVLLVAGTTGVGACPATGAGNVIDRVGYGSGVCFESAAATSASAANSIQRIPNGTDTNVNSADFRLGAGTPRAVNASQADLRISQADAPDPATAGGQVTYTLTVSNTGGADATGVAVNFTLPTGSATYTFTSAGDAGSSGFTATNNAGVINFTGGNVAAGSTATLTIVVTTTGAGTLTSTGANVIVDPNNTVAELNETNNTANSSTTTVNAAAVNPTVNLTITPSTGSEADSTQFTATVTASAVSTTDQTVSFTLTGGTAGTADFTRIPATITIPANSLTGTVTFSVVDDTLVEATESATFAIGNPSSGITLGTTTSASVGITDNDVAPTITLSPATLPPGTVGAAYNQTITASGGTAPYTFLVTAGVLPNGLTLNPNTGVISGTPTTATNAEFNVTATDANGFTGSRAYTITINAASIVLGNPQCQGLAVPPLRAGTTNRALMCFSLTANNGAQFTGLTVRFSTDPSLKYSNPRLVGSTDADYGTAENNALVATGTVDNEKFTFGGFTAFTEEARAFGENNPGEALKPNLTAQPTYFFVVVDVLPTVDGSTPASTPTVSVSDITTNPPAAVTGTTATSPTPITFAPAGPSAATVNIGGRVVTARGRAIFRVRVKMTDSRGVVRSTFTNASGFYRFADVETGQVLTLSIKHKGYKFPDTTVSLNEETNSVNFKAN